MSAARAAVLLLAAACYRPAPPAGVPCSLSNECPGSQLCIEGICEGEPSSGDAPTDQGPQGRVVVIGDVDTEIDDTFVWGITGEADQTHDGDVELSVDVLEVGMVRFDLAEASPDMRVMQATLRLQVFDDASEEGGTVGIHRMREQWVGSEATWNRARVGVPWRRAGAGAPESRDADPVAEVRPNTLGTAFDVELPVDLVQTWLENPGENFGLALVRGTAMQHVHFTSATNNLPSSMLTLHLVPKP